MTIVNVIKNMASKNSNSRGRTSDAESKPKRIQNGGTIFTEIIAGHTNESTTSNTGASQNSTNSDLEKIMSGLREGDKKSNIIQMNMGSYFTVDPLNVVAGLLEQSNNLSSKTYRMNFDPVQEIVLKKMVGNDMLSKRLVIEEHDFFKGLISINYYCTVIGRSYDVVDELYSFAKSIERIDRSKDPLIADVVEHLIRDSIKKNILLQSYNERNAKVGFNSFKQDINLKYNYLMKRNELYYGAAKIINSTIDSLSNRISGIDSRADLSALIFIDTLHSYISKAEDFALVDNLMVSKDYFKASMVAMQLASRNYYNEKINENMRKAHETRS